MNDQAEGLRRRLASMGKKQTAKTISFISGKGGVGKSNIALNFSLSLLHKHKKVLLIDFDIGMGNIEILLGTSTNKSIVDMFETHLGWTDIIHHGPNNLDFISGGFGLTKIFELDQEKREHFLTQFQRLMEIYDFIIFDMGAGVTEDSMFFILASDECIVITTPEPTAVTDGYGIIKHVVNNEPSMPIYVVMNRIETRKAGIRALRRFQQVIQKFLKKEIALIGNLPNDNWVQVAVTRQVPFVLLNKRAPISKAVMEMVDNYLSCKRINNGKVSLSFIQKLRGFIGKR